MSWINLGEVFYTVHRAASAAQADAKLAMLRPLVTLDAPTPERVLAAARLKALHPVAYADASQSRRQPLTAPFCLPATRRSRAERWAAAWRTWRGADLRHETLVAAS
jgi:hypothetical protein